MNLNRMIADAGLSDSVIQTGFVSHSRAQQYLDISDFCINLRYPTAGETSRSVLQLMASRKPVIVSNVGWFAELPDNACLKVDVDRFEEEMLLEYMIALSSDSKFRNAIGLNAYDYIVRHHDPRQIARDYYSFIKNVLDCNEYMINILSRQMHAMDIREDEPALIGYSAGRLRDLF
jgi:glycosyltransferase involved in cell wall biosynthesis